MRLHNLITALFLLPIFGSSCRNHTHVEPKPVAKRNVPERVKPSGNITYHFEKPSVWLHTVNGDDLTLKIIYAVNRVDSAHLKSMDSIIVPDETKADLVYYLPFPLHLDAATDIDKIIFFSYPAQAFGAYENGELIYTGPTNMGRKKDPTPTGLFFTNWKAEKTTSTFNDEWELKWNFNIENKEGVGWHEYAMPGYPASHSCMRLAEMDVRYLYTWADQWVLDHDSVKDKGTPVIVFGDYDFDEPKPWLQLVTSPHALDILENELAGLLAPHKKEILDALQKRKQEDVANKF